MSATDTEPFTYKPQTKAALIRQHCLTQAMMLPAQISDLPTVVVTSEHKQIIGNLLEACNLAGVDALTELTHEKLDNCLLLLAMISTGSCWKDASEITGVTWAMSEALKRKDKRGYGELLKAALAARDAYDRDRLRTAMVKRAVDGVSEPIVGRIGKDQDGVIAHKQRYSDRLAEFALSHLDKETFGEVAGNVNTGTQIVYNISGVAFDQIPAPAAQPAIEAEIQPDTDNPGNNPATIDMMDID